KFGFMRFLLVVILIALCAGAWWGIITQAYTPLLDQIPDGIADLITRALPMLLILIGLGFFLRGRIPLGSIASLIISLALVGGVATMAYSGKSSQLSTDQNLTFDYPIDDSITLLVVNVSALTTEITINTAPQTGRITGSFVGSKQSTITQTQSVNEQGVGEITIAETKSAEFPSLNSIGRGKLDVTLPTNTLMVLNVVNQDGNVTLSLGDSDLERMTLTITKGDGVVALPNYEPISLKSEELPSEFIISGGDLTLLIPSEVDARLIYLAQSISETPTTYIESREAGLTILRPNPDTFTTDTAPRLFYDIEVPSGDLRVELREDD
ncbi:MAG: hypothetical protein SFZ02_10615, partial [bacterium]|nr:hypothetical protein [bacterium]